MEDEQTQVNSDYSQNESANMDFNNASVLQVRLDTDPIIRQLEVTLKGSILKVMQAEDGTIYDEEFKISEPMCNEIGYQAIINNVSAILNRQGLQSFLQDDQKYRDYVSRYYKRFITDLMRNRVRWGVEKQYFPVITHSVMNSIELILTQAIKGGTRQSISASTRVTESSSAGQKGSVMNLFRTR